MEDTKKVKTTEDLYVEAQVAVESLGEHMSLYDHARSTDASKEERFNEGRYGRLIIENIDKAQAALTQLRMRVNLQLEGRDSARAKQLDRILGIAEDIEDVAIGLSIIDYHEGRGGEPDDGEDQA
jgi:hypothetical protein